MSSDELKWPVITVRGSAIIILAAYAIGGGELALYMGIFIGMCLFFYFIIFNS